MTHFILLSLSCALTLRDKENLMEACGQAAGTGKQGGDLSRLARCPDSHKACEGLIGFGSRPSSLTSPQRVGPSKEGTPPSVKVTGQKP